MGQWVDTRGDAGFLEISSAILDNFIWSLKVIKIPGRQEEKMFKFVFITTTVDGLSLIGAKVSAHKVMATLGCRKRDRYLIEGYKISCIRKHDRGCGETVLNPFIKMGLNGYKSMCHLSNIR